MQTMRSFSQPPARTNLPKAILHTIFFHRYFSSVRPSTFEVLDFTDPSVSDQELGTLIETRAGQLLRQLGPNASSSASTRGKLSVLFYEKKRKKAGAGLGWFGTGKVEEDILWEKWSLIVTLATPNTEHGGFQCDRRCCVGTDPDSERDKILRAAGASLQKSMLQVIKIVNREKAHIPAITSNEVNPFPYKIDITPRIEGLRS